MDIILMIIILYVFVVFILSRFIIPHLGFTKTPLPKKIPVDMEQKINNLRTKANSSNDFLKLSYDFLGNKYRTGRINTFLKFNYLFKSFDEIWKIQGFAPCTQSGYIMRIFLVRSGFFKEEDIKVKHTFFNFNIHQYLRVRVENKWIDVDVGEKQRGMPIGKHLRFFG